jgi:ABC-type multidrug transport system ATPase subunit
MTINVSNLGKRFNREWIFKGLTAEFRSGNIYAITGPNGSGKSTLMQILWGQAIPSEGTIEYGLNNKIVSEDDVFRHVSIATPYMDLVEELTLAEHIEFHFKFRRPVNGLSTPEIIDQMQLKESMNKPIRQFSSGMKQRVKLGMAMFSESEALFLDEPTTNLDSQSSSWYLGRLSEIMGKRLVFVATNQESDYPKGTATLNLNDLKKVTNTNKNRIESV